MVFWKTSDKNSYNEGSAADQAPPSDAHQPQETMGNSDNKLHLNPGMVMLGISLPMCARAYHLYHSPLHDLLEKVAVRNKLSVHEIKEADIGVRRAAGMAVAGRALKLASLVSFGGFNLLGAAVFFTMGWNSLEEGITETRQWANSKRKRLDKLLGVEQRVDEDHPEYKSRKAMTREEEAAHLAKRYWIAKDPNKPGDSDGNNNK